MNHIVPNWNNNAFQRSMFNVQCAEKLNKYYIAKLSKVVQFSMKAYSHHRCSFIMYFDPL